MESGVIRNFQHKRPAPFSGLVECPMFHDSGIAWHQIGPWPHSTVCFIQTSKRQANQIKLATT